MKIPVSPPDPNPSMLWGRLPKQPEAFAKLMMSVGTGPKGRYEHWDKLRHLELPEGVPDHKTWWAAIKFTRAALYKQIPHYDKIGHPFVFGEPDCVRKLLHEIDVYGGGTLKSQGQIANPSTRETYLVNSLIEEAITSSQLEGAATTRKVAKEMLRQKRKPRNRSEMMIANNYRAMEFIKQIANENLTPSLIFELHRILTEGTLDNEKAIGRLRQSDDIHVGDERDSTILHEPPRASELPKRIRSLCDFANGKTKLTFLHSVIHAILLHFLLAYDHPFEDGNGRTARALFYWSMLRENYWTLEFISISRILKSAPSKYARAYLYTETDDNDVTYFIVHQLEVIKRAIDDLLGYFDRKAKEMRSIESIISQSPKLRQLLNYRQIALINKALNDPAAVFYIEAHRGAHNVTYETARSDLLRLAEIGLLEKNKAGKAFVFTPVKDLKDKLQRAGRR